MKRFVYTTLLLFLAAALAVQAQVSFSVAYKRVNATTIDIVFTGTADAGWHIYSTNIADGGPTAASFGVDRIKGAKLKGKLSGWASPKDVILEILGRLTVKGGTNAILEYFGEGVASLSATGRATICNMGAELGATCSMFPFDNNTATYLRQTSRDDVADMALANADDLKADAEVYAEPEKYFDQLITIDLSALEPHLNGPFTPDAATPLSEMKARAPHEGYPLKVEVALVGSCTNSSYQDLARAASVARQALAKRIPMSAELIINPGSEMIRATAERDGILDDLRKVGGVIMTNACGPCIGQWKRHTDDNNRKNTIVTSFNRNFRRRADGNPNTYAFIALPWQDGSTSIPPPTS